jgi:hypothetical protein
MALQSNVHLHLLNALLPVSSVYELSFQIVILHSLISVCTQLQHLSFGHPLSQLPRGLLLNARLTFLLLSILSTWPIQFNWLILTNESISKPPHGRIISCSHYCLQFSFTLIPPNILFKTLLSKVASYLAGSLFSAQELQWVSPIKITVYKIMLV